MADGRWQQERVLSTPVWCETLDELTQIANELEEVFADAVQASNPTTTLTFHWRDRSWEAPPSSQLDLSASDVRKLERISISVRDQGSLRELIEMSLPIKRDRGTTTLIQCPSQYTADALELSVKKIISRHRAPWTHGRLPFARIALSMVLNAALWLGLIYGIGDGDWPEPLADLVGILFVGLIFVGAAELVNSRLLPLTDVAVSRNELRWHRRKWILTVPALLILGSVIGQLLFGES